MSEEALDIVMEECLKNKHYNIMERTLEGVKDTYSKYEHYKKELEEIKFL